MDEERFSKIEKGMTESDVRRELGQVKHQNIRKYEDGKVIAWFYPKAGGAAAAIFFRTKDGELKVYDTNFDAVESAAERAGQEAAGEGPGAD
jgi:predicted transcriptional regulator